MRTSYLQQSLLGVIPCLLGTVTARRGGGGGGSSGSDSGYNGGSNSGGSSGGVVTHLCLPAEHLYVNLPNHRYTSHPCKGCAGPYYVGKTIVKFALNNGEGELLEDGGICENQGLQATISPEVMLGAASIAPQYDIDGMINTFILGFNAWRPDTPVDDVEPLDFSVCWLGPQIRFATTSRFTEYPGRGVSEARDLVIMSLSKSNISSTVHFNGTYMGHPKGDYDMAMLPAIWDGRWHHFYPGSSLCENPTFDTAFPNKTTISGLISPDALSLTLEGVLLISARNNTILNFTVEFRGAFDSANSTHSAVVNGTHVILSGTRILVPPGFAVMVVPLLLLGLVSLIYV